VGPLPDGPALSVSGKVNDLTTTYREQIPRPGNPLHVVSGDADDFGMQAPPHDLDAERSVLGAMMLSEGNAYDIRDDVVEVLGGLGKEAFYHPAHQKVWSALARLHAEGVSTSNTAVVQALRVSGDLRPGDTGTTSYVHGLLSASPSQSSAQYDAETVRDLAMRRRIETALAQCQQFTSSGEGSVAEVAAFVQEKVANAVDDAVPTDTTFRTGDFVDDVIDDLERKPEEGLIGLPTSYPDVDVATTGLRNGEYIIVAGRPAMGKSVVATDFARKNAIQGNVPVLIFSLEMKKEDLAVRIISAEQRVALHHLRSKDLSEGDWHKISKGVSALAEAPLYIDDAPNQTMGEIESKARRYVKKHGVRLLIVDYLQLVKPDRPTGDSTRDVSHVSERMRALAKSLDVPIVALAQLNRAGSAGGEVREPTLTDLKQSGQIEQDAHVVILLHRDDYYNKESPRAGEADFILAKNRSGATGRITVAFQGHYSRFVDMTGC
jgi:replicative DNA helicase